MASARRLKENQTKMAQAVIVQEQQRTTQRFHSCVMGGFY